MSELEPKDDVQSELADDVVSIGGPPDRLRVSLCIYADDLEPEFVTSRLGVAPTQSHRKGELFGSRQLERRIGAWILKVEAAADADAQEPVNALLSQLPDDASVWSELAANHDIVISFGLFFDAWNRGFVIAPEAVARFATMRAELAFDIYAS